jgi:hypothetical protein
MLEVRYSKSRILEAYLNNVYLGQMEMSLSTDSPCPALRGKDVAGSRSTRRPCWPARSARPIGYSAERDPKGQGVGTRSFSP